MRQPPAHPLNNSIIRLKDELHKRDQQIALFKEVVNAVQNRLSLERIFEMVAVFARNLIQAETVLIPVLDEDCQHYTYRAGSGLNAEEIVGESLHIDMGICGWVWRHNRPWWRGVLEELSENERNRWEKEVGSVILVPLVGSNHFLGGIAGINKTGGRDFDKQDLDLLTLLASQIATAIDNNALIDQLEKANQTIINEKVKAQITLASIADAVITTDKQGLIDYLNPVAEDLFDVPLSEARTKRPEQLGTLLYERNRQLAVGLVEQCLSKGQLPSQFLNLILVRQDGREFYIESTAAPILDQDKTSGLVLTFHDVSQARELTQKLSHQATHDALTGLFNRSEFEYRVQQEIQDAQTRGSEHSLLHLDLDQFKVINDTCGHTAGDELIKQYSAALLAKLHPNDTLARIGGDEFGILLLYCPPPLALDIANSILDATHNFRFVWGDKTFSIGISIGLIGIDNRSESLMQTMSRVDAACHMAKEAGRNRIYLYDEEDTALHKRHGEMEWTPRITKALEEGRIVLYCQPIARRETPSDLESHYEILIRMKDESGNLILPGEFLPADERYNLIATIDCWVVSTYFRWLAEHPSHLQILELGSINLAGSTLSNDACLAHIENQLREFAIPPEKICFEITETEAIANLSKAAHFIDRLKSLGCRFALDDFGSGFSSYAYLKNLPVDFLKIDGMFVKDMDTDPANYAMVESINHIGHVMGRKTIAEFVENQALVQLASGLGLDYLQGFGIAKPRPLGDFI